MKCFDEFLALVGLDEGALGGINKVLSSGGPAPSQNFYSLLTAFSIFLQTKTSARASLLAKATAVGYMSQVVNLLRERYPMHMIDSKRISKIREKMASAIEERNLLANVQTKDAPGCKLEDLQMLVQDIVVKGVGSGFKSMHDAAILTLMWHTFGRAIDTCFARKSQLSIATSGELFLHVARIKTSVVQGVSIYKAAEHWEQCMLHGLDMLFVGSPEPSSYIFPLVPRVAVSDLPGGQTYSQDEAILFWENLDAKEETRAQQPAKKVRTRPNVSKYINDLIAQCSQHHSTNPTAQPSTDPAISAEHLPAMTTGLSSHSLRRGAAAYANASPKLSIQWISTRGAWLLDSLTKAFAYVGTTTREDQSVGKVLAGFKDPDLPCATPSIRTLRYRLPDLEFAQLAALRRQLFKNVTGFSDASLNVAPDVLDAAIASLLIHLEEVVAAVDKERESSGFTSHYIYRFHEAIEATNAALGSRLSMATCVGWGRQMKAAWKTDNFAQVGTSSGGNSAVLTAAITQILSSISSIERAIAKLADIQEKQSKLRNNDDQAEALEPHVPARLPDIVPEASTLAGCLYNWYTYTM